MSWFQNTDIPLGPATDTITQARFHTLCQTSQTSLLDTSSRPLNPSDHVRCPRRNVTSAAQVVYGVSTWNPLEVAVLWNNRAAQFFAALCWMFAVMGTNISANSVSFSNDLALWFPKYINSRRGAYICCLLSIASTPWNIQYRYVLLPLRLVAHGLEETDDSSATTFSSFLGGYSLFLGALAGVIITDFWICRRGALDVRQLYKKHGIHRFTKGINVRAFVAFVAGIAPDLPGLAAACGASGVPKAASYLYSLSWLVATIVSGLVYWLSFKVVAFEVSPAQEMYMDGVEGVEAETTSASIEFVKKDFDS